MTETLEHIKEDMVAPKCFVCSRGMQQGDLAFCLFAHRYRTDGSEDMPISEVLSSILSLDILDSNTNSKIICEECNERLSKYELLEQQMLELKYKIIQDFSATSRCSENDNEPNFEIEVTFDEGIENAPPTPIDDDGETVMPDNKSTANTEEASNAELLSLLTEHKDISHDIHQEESIAGDIIVKQENIKSELETGEYFDQNTGNIVEILPDDNAEYKYSSEKVDETVHVVPPLTEAVDDDDDSSQYPELDGQSFFYFNGLKYICLICSSESSHESNEFIDIEAISEHLRESHGVSAYFCRYCGDEFNGKNDLDKHCQKKHSEEMTIDEQNKTDTKRAEDQKAYLFNGETFTCLLCPEDSEEGQTKYNLRAITTHFKSIHYMRVYICDICGMDFKKRMELTEHVDEVHGGAIDGEYQCETCQRIFTNLRQFRIHKRLHYSMNKSYQCPECDKKYSSKNLLDEHMNMHTGKRPYKCQVCPKDFASKYTLTAHMKIHMNRPRPFYCKSCNKSFFSAQNLLQHEKIHSGIKEFVCDICNKAFGTQHNLDVHKIVHTGYKPFVCRTCGKAFARRAEIKDHERTHTGERPFVCEICNMSFAQRSNLTTHKRATHLNDKRYKCELCDRSFKRRRLLDYHIKASHTGERPYVCTLCNATFVYPEHHKKHLRIHTGVKPYSCEVCGKSFNSRDNRNAHRFVHSDKKPYECLVCGQGFMRKPLLLTHMQQSGHVNDTIVINQPRIMDSEKQKSNDGKVPLEVMDELVEEQMLDGQHQYVDEELVAVIENTEDNSLSNEILEDEFNEVMDTYVVRYEDETEAMQFVQIG